MNSVFTFLELGIGFLGPSPLLSASKKKKEIARYSFMFLPTEGVGPYSG